MYYLRLNKEDQQIVEYYCRNCPEFKQMDTEINSVVSSISCGENKNKNKNEDISNYVNEFTKYDPTYPRTNTIKCENCTEKSDVVIVRYDDFNLKYLYICSHCDFVWT